MSELAVNDKDSTLKKGLICQNGLNSTVVSPIEYDISSYLYSIRI